MCEVLSPVGDKEGFYTAIKSGCDAVYFGLPKFNARLRAENISLDNLQELVSFAHLKGVKCYMTLNTILTDKEIAEGVDLVGKCLGFGVDAFIVQDLGLIYALKSVYPDIVLHGSTQMGIHNVRGARVAKSLGLSRIVLSRECTLSDIKEIKENVDIELEVFVQGAMCVAFSGNCYMSAIKHGASGNRGECKQLCRLNYTLSDNAKKVTGYPLSIRDNCMLDYLEDLISLGVASLKIEGRLRHTGYIAVATSTYRLAVDNIKKNIKSDYNSLKNNLYRVFSRGEYIPLYNSGNDVIDVATNNHMGVYIGEVISSTKFKDIYKTTIKSNEKINTGDGLKFLSDTIISMGVGNVEYIGDKCVVYGKNYIKTGSKVYKALDIQFESSFGDNSRRRKVDIEFEGIVGNRCILRYISGGVHVEVMGDICERAKSKPTDMDTIITQLTKWDSDVFVLGEKTVTVEDVYIPLSKLNDMRRRGIDLLKEKILAKETVQVSSECSLSDILLLTPQMPFENMLLGDESFSGYKDLNEYDAFILSPLDYSLKNIKSFISKFEKYSSKPLIINLPIIALDCDLKIIDNIVDTFKDKVYFMANNIYAFDYISSGAKIIGGYNLNIINNYSASMYLKLGASALTSSIEKSFARLKGCYKYAGKSVLMTFAHCPHKTLNHNDCIECSCDGKMKLVGTSGEFFIRRYRVAKCYFELVDDKVMPRSGENLIVDVRS